MLDRASICNHRVTTRPQYSALVLTRDRSKMIQLTLNSIINQTVPPLSICVVDDGSSDDTPFVLEMIRQKYPRKINIVTLEDEGYDIRRVVRNTNVGIEVMNKARLNAEYIMISGDDCIYPQHYAEQILERMNKDRNIVIASGDIEGILHPDVTPRGSGRFIRMSFLREIGGYFPPYYGYEGWILQKALHLGYSVKIFPEIRYRHLCKIGKQHGYKDWGLAMKCLGYSPFEVIYRCIKYPLADRRVSVGYMRVLWDYFIYSIIAKAKRDPYYHFFDEDIRSYIGLKQRRRMIHRISNFLRFKRNLQDAGLSRFKASEKNPENGKLRNAKKDLERNT